MNEIIFFALALLAVPVFARYADVSKDVIRIYHLVGISGLFLMLTEITRHAAMKIAILVTILPFVDYLATMLAFLLVLVGTVALSIYYIRHPKEIQP